MPWLFLVALFGLARIGAAGECAELPLCARLAQPGAAFFVGEAVSERHRDGHKPEYRFQVREVLIGLAPGTDYAVVETDEGAPPAGLLLVEARVVGDGTITRGQCDLAEPDAAAIDMLGELRRLRTVDAVLSVKASDARGRVPADVRILADGPLSRMAERDGRFPGLVPGAYRVTVSALGYQTKSHEMDLLPGSCPAVEIRLAGTAELTGATRPGERIRAIDADGEALAATATADGQGWFRLPGLPPGRYVLSGGSTFYPGSPLRADASIIHLGPGAKVELNGWAPR